MTSRGSLRVIPAEHLDDAEVSVLRRKLLAWFDEVARPLPWRTSRDPYAIWVSEVMSQQTRIETVIPYFERWLHRFPDIATLADAAEEDVLKQWEGLGYYSRARNLHRAAQFVRERHHSTVPLSYDELRALPGVGDYTAGAVASIAGGERTPAVDGNVRRVLARLFDLPAPSPRTLRDLAAQLVPEERPGDFNQALMELGATVCTPRAPRCSRCPVNEHCRALHHGTQLDRPAPKVRKPVPVYDLVTGIFVDPAGHMLLVRRTGGLLRGMWSFPAIPVADAAAASDGMPRLADTLGLIIGEARALAVVEHTFSHRRERYHCFIAKVGSGDVMDGVWAGEDTSRLALPRAQQKIRALALAALDSGLRG